MEGVRSGWEPTKINLVGKYEQITDSNQFIILLLHFKRVKWWYHVDSPLWWYLVGIGLDVSWLLIMIAWFYPLVWRISVIETARWNEMKQSFYSPLLCEDKYSKVEYSHNGLTRICASLGLRMNLTRICTSLGLCMKFKTLFMSDNIGRLDCSPL